MARRPTYLLMAAAWLVVVVGVSAVVWAVIGSAGRQALTAPVPVPLPATGVTGAPDGPDRGSVVLPPGTAATGKPEIRQPPATSAPGPPDPASSSAAPMQLPSPSPGRPGTAGAGPTNDSGTEPGGADPGGGAPTSAPPTTEPPSTGDPDAGGGDPAAEPDPEAQPQVRTWAGSPGTLTVRCDGRSIALQAVTPNDGWAVAVGEEGPKRVVATFTSVDDEQQWTRVEARCAGGVPRFRVEPSG